MTFIGTYQFEILNNFAKKYNLDVDYKLYRVKLGKQWALYRASNPSRIRNNKLKRTFYRWEWKNPTGQGVEAPRLDYILLHGMHSKNAKETVFVIEKSALDEQIRKYPGQKEKISLDTDTSPHANHNKRTKFFFPFAKGSDEFRAWLKRAAVGG